MTAPAPACGFAWVGDYGGAYLCAEPAGHSGEHCAENGCMPSEAQIETSVRATIALGEIAKMTGAEPPEKADRRTAARLWQAVSAVLLAALLLPLSGCALARARAIANMDVMPEAVDTEGWERHCVLYANTGACQQYVLVPPESPAEAAP